MKFMYHLYLMHHIIMHVSAPNEMQILCIWVFQIFKSVFLSQWPQKIGVGGFGYGSVASSETAILFIGPYSLCRNYCKTESSKPIVYITCIN